MCVTTTTSTTTGTCSVIVTCSITQVAKTVIVTYWCKTKSDSRCRIRADTYVSVRAATLNVTVICYRVDTATQSVAVAVATQSVIAAAQSVIAATN